MFHQHENEYYNLGVVERIFTPGGIVRVIVILIAKNQSNFESDLSTPHEIISVKGVIVTLKEINSNRKYVSKQRG